MTHVSDNSYEAGKQVTEAGGCHVFKGDCGSSHGKDGLQ
jgi:hypothetical protein